jgi:hypothetical protein
MEIDEGDEACAMQICDSDSDSSEDFLVGPLLHDLRRSSSPRALDSIGFRLALKSARAKHGQFGTCYD